MSTPSRTIPLLHPFRTQQGQYLYDAKTNEILRLEEGPFKASLRYLDDLADPKTGISPPDEINHLVDAGYFSHGVFNSMEPNKCTDCLNQDLDSSLQQLTLEIGTGCNLRCSYCVFSGEFSGRREHGNHRMSQETALAGIDYLLSHSSMADHCALGIYGGEPFLDFPLIRRTISKIREQSTRDIHVSLTSNGTLLDREIAEWCVSEKVALLISLDGPEENHDRNRRAAGGQSTWAKVMNSLRMLQNLDPDYYRFNVGISSVIANNVSPQKADEFFSSPQYHDLFHGTRISVSFEDMVGKEISVPLYPNFHEEVNRLRQKFISAVINGDVDAPNNRFVRMLFERPLLDLYKRSIVPILAQKKIGLNGMCTPGVRKLFVAADGTLFSCERVNQAYPLGSVHTGLQHDAVFNLLDEYQQFNERRCTKCWAARLCHGCQASVSGPNGFDYNVAQRLCRGEREQLHSTLQIFCNLLEYSPTSLDYMEDISFG